MHHSTAKITVTNDAIAEPVIATLFSSMIKQPNMAYLDDDGTSLNSQIRGFKEAFSFRGQIPGRGLTGMFI